MGDANGWVDFGDTTADRTFADITGENVHNGWHRVLMYNGAKLTGSAPLDGGWTDEGDGVYSRTETRLLGRVYDTVTAKVPT
jgi:hypothetical protein